jgi:hypothetical protein
MLKKLAIAAGVVGLLIAGVVGYAATGADDFRIERSARIKATPDKIHAQIQDFRRWQGWSPWETIDPALKRTMSGTPQGKGAVYEWVGNNDVGSGRMEIVEAAPERIVIKLDFFKPFEAHNLARFTLQPDGDATRVTWTMTGPQPLLNKVVCLFMNMDKMVGGHFETGLANLRRLTEA